MRVLRRRLTVLTAHRPPRSRTRVLSLSQSILDPSTQTGAVDHGLEYSGRRSPRWAGERPCEIGDLLEQIHIIGDTTKQSPARILVQVIFLEQREKALATERHGRHRKLASSG